MTPMVCPSKFTKCLQLIVDGQSVLTNNSQIQLFSNVFSKVYGRHLPNSGSFPIENNGVIFIGKTVAGKFVTMLQQLVCQTTL